MNSANSPAPALRTMSGATTAGSSQTPYMKAWAGGNAAKAAPVAFHSRPQAQKTTPNATPRTAVTTMSTVRQRVAGGGIGRRRTDGLLGHGFLQTPCAGMTRIRFEGLRCPALSAPKRSPAVNVRLCRRA